MCGMEEFIFYQQRVRVKGNREQARDQSLSAKQSVCPESSEGKGKLAEPSPAARDVQGDMSTHSKEAAPSLELGLL